MADNNLVTFDQLMQAIAMRESSMNPNAESDKGAIGLFGIMPGDAMKGMRGNVPTVWEAAEMHGFVPRDRSRATAEALLRDPLISETIAEAYTRELLTKYGGDTEATLTAYNAGPAKYDRLGSAAAMDKPEQREYARKVSEDYQNFFGYPLPSNLGVLVTPRPQARPRNLLEQQ